MAHSFGRIPSPPDERDFKLEEVMKLKDTSPLSVALLKLQASSYVAKATKNWAATITEYLEGGVPDNPPTPTPAPSKDTLWENTEPVLDQGDYGTCVGNGFAQWGNTNPYDDKFTEKDARAIYYEATVIDGFPDDPDKQGGGQQGSTVRSGAAAMVNRKRAAVYAFTSDLDTMKKFLQESGPMVVGTDFYYDMETPDDNGYVKPTGGVADGHCYLLAGDLESEGAFEFLNSWGEDWGQKGYFKMKYGDFMKLVADQGEVCAIVELELI